jgi:glycosyltransferase involved in cell wall biosynthesis
MDPIAPDSRRTAAEAVVTVFRILFVTPRFGTSIGGVETHIREVGRRLADGGHSVTVLAADETRRLPSEERRFGMRIVRVPAWPRGHDWQFAPGLPAAILRQRADLVHLQSYHTLVAPLALPPAVATTPTVVTFHSGGHSSAGRRAVRGMQLLALRPWLRSARRLVAVSGFEADELARRLRLRRSRFEVIPNGADLAPDAPSATSTSRSRGLVLSVGRLEAYKGHDRAILALPHLLARVPEARLRIVGLGPDRDRLVRLAEEAGVAGHVDIGSVAFDDAASMRRLLESASAVVLLSSYESQGIVAFEALAAATPVVVADGSALHELVVAGHALGVARDAPPHGVAAVILEALAAGPTPTIPELPTWDRAAIALDRLYHDVLRPT